MKLLKVILDQNNIPSFHRDYDGKCRVPDPILTLNLGLISSRYLGIPPVTERTLKISYAEIFFGQNFLQSDRGNSFNVNVNEMRPTKPVLLKIFFSIQADAEPHITNISWSFSHVNSCLQT